MQEGSQVKQDSMEVAWDRGVAPGVGWTADHQSLLLDSAIGHCEKLRRVLELEAWIREARDNPILTRAAEQWSAEREQLIVELEL
jgi:hypothetical protein